MSSPAINLNELIAANPLPADHPYWEREKKITERIEAVREFQEKQPCHPEMRELSQCKNHLVSLIGPENAAPFLKALDTPINDFALVTEASSVDATFKMYSDGVVLQEALSRMIRLLAKTRDNGKGVLDKIEKSGGFHDVDSIKSIIERLEPDLAMARKDQFYGVARKPNFDNCLMYDVHWHMGGEKYFSRAEFDEAVLQYRLNACITGYWDPAMIAVLSPCVRIECSNWDGEDFNPLLEFESDNGFWFTEGELLFKIHNAVFEQCNNSDHGYFEGIELHRNQESGKPPLYSLIVGS